MTQRQRAALCWMVCAGVWAGTAHAQAPEPKPTKEWRIGRKDVGAVEVAVLVPLAGKHKALGRAVVDGLVWASMWLEVPLWVRVYDAGETPEGAAALTAWLRERSEVAAVIGPLGQQIAEAAALETGSLPMLSLSSSDGVEAKGARVFRVRVSAEDQARGMGGLAVGAIGHTRAAVMYPDDDYGRSCALAFAEAFVAGGGEVVAFEPYSPGQTKLQAVAERVAGKKARSVLPSGQAAPAKTKPQAIFIPDGGAQVTKILPFLDAEGVLAGVQLLGTSAWVGEALRLSEGRATGALIPLAFDERATPEVEAGVTAFEDHFGRAPSALEAQTHDALMLLAQSIQKCGPAPERDCIAQRLQSGEAVEGITGPTSLTPQRTPAHSLYIFEIDSQGQPWPAY